MIYLLVSDVGSDDLIVLHIFYSRNRIIRPKISNLKHC